MQTNILTIQNQEPMLKSTDDLPMNPCSRTSALLEPAIELRTSGCCVHGHLRKITANPVYDGRCLAAGCLSDLKCHLESGMTPHLFILIVSEAYSQIPLLPELRRGIELELKDWRQHNTDTIISRFCEFVFQPDSNIEGAILMCLATRITFNNRDHSQAVAANYADLASLGLPS